MASCKGTLRVCGTPDTGGSILALLGKPRNTAERPEQSQQSSTELLLVEPSPKEMSVLAIIRRVPRGKVVTYGEVARLADLPGRARRVGKVLARCPLANAVPWHRVVNSRGVVSLRGTAEQVQRARLAAEGVCFDSHNRIDLSKDGWCPRQMRDGKCRNRKGRVRSRHLEGPSYDGSE